VPDDAYVQVAADATGGKRIANFAVTLPAGTLVTDADGVQTALSVETTVFVQRTAVSDPATGVAAQVSGEADRGRLNVGAEDIVQSNAQLIQRLDALIQLLTHVITQ
jgi:hypothetical protein